MLELTQMTLTDYADIKNEIRNSMTKAVVSFVEIGFYLKKIKSEKLYLNDGYKDVWEAAESEFGLKRKQAWSFMNINDKYSVDGNSLELLPQYEGFSKSTLTEMLTLPDEDYELITKETKIEDIRELKQAEAEHEKEIEEENQQIEGQSSILDFMPEAVPEQDKPKPMLELSVEDAIKRIFKPKEMRAPLNKLCTLSGESLEFQYWVEEFNPSGNRVEKVMPYFIFFYKYQDGVKIKNIVTQQITEMSYLQFRECLAKALDEYINIPFPEKDIWAAAFGEEQEPVSLKENAVSSNLENKEAVNIEQKNKEAVSEEKKVEEIKKEHQNEATSGSDETKNQRKEESKEEILSGTVENPVCDIAQNEEQLLMYQKLLDESKRLTKELADESYEAAEKIAERIADTCRKIVQEIKDAKEE